MKLAVLGSGSAFTLEEDNYQSNFILENDEGKRLLIDCGSDARWSLHKFGLSYRDIDGVFISHLHGDHTGGLDWLAFNTYFDPSCKKPALYISSLLVDDLWNKSLAGSLSSLEMIKAELSTYFNVIVIENDTFFNWFGLNVSLIKTIHAISNQQILPSYGLFFSINDTNVFITGDTRFLPNQFKNLYKQASIIFHDCETSHKPTGIHAHYEELKTLDEEIKRKMWLYQYSPGPLPDANKDGFKGFLLRGQKFNFPYVRKVN